MRWKILSLLCLAILFAKLYANGMAAAEDREQALQHLMAEARLAQSRGDFAAAAVSYRKATLLDPSIPQIWADLGLMYHQMGKPSEAIQSFEKAVNLDPSLFVPQLFLGIENLQMENPRAAVIFLENATKLHPNDPEVALALGAAYAMLRNGELAAKSYSKATELAPNNAKAWLGLGTAYLQQVEDDARVMTSTYGRSGYAKLRAAETLTQQDKWNQAENAYRAAISAPSVPPCAHTEFGLALLHQGKVNQAREQFQLEMGSASHCGLMQLGIAAADAADGQLVPALNVLIAASKADPNFVRSNSSLLRSAIAPDRAAQILDLARARRNKGTLSAEISLVVESILEPNNTAAASTLAGLGPPSGNGMHKSLSAQALFSKGDFWACEQALLPAFPAMSAANQRLLASCSYYTGDFRTTSLVTRRLKANSATRVEGLYWESKADEKLAVAALARAGEIAPNSPRMHVLLGDVYRQKRRWGDAEKEYREAVSLDPSNRAARLSLAIVLFTELKTAEALEIDKSLLQEIPSDPEANLLAGEILAQQHLFAQAEPYLSRCHNLRPELVPRLHVLLGQVDAATGRIPEAISEYKLGSVKDDDGSIHYQLARLYLKVGNRTAAENEIRISQELRKRWDNQAHIDLGQSPVDADP